MDDFENVLKKDSPTPAFIPEGLSFDAIIKNETAVVSTSSLSQAGREGYGMLTDTYVPAMFAERFHGLSPLRRAPRRRLAIFPLVLQLHPTMERLDASTKTPLARVGARESQGTQVSVLGISTPASQKRKDEQDPVCAG